MKGLAGGVRWGVWVRNFVSAITLGSRKVDIVVGHCFVTSSFPDNPEKS